MVETSKLSHPPNLTDKLKADLVTAEIVGAIEKGGEIGA